MKTHGKLYESLDKGSGKAEMIIAREFTFDSAHKLGWHKGKCKNFHGHTYRLQIWVKGPLTEDGIVLDFAELDQIVKRKVVEILDHRLLNDIIENPTAENICIWVWNELIGDLNCLYEIRLWETPKSFAVYNGE